MTCVNDGKSLNTFDRFLLGTIRSTVTIPVPSDLPGLTFLIGRFKKAGDGALFFAELRS